MTLLELLCIDKYFIIFTVSHILTNFGCIFYSFTILRGFVK